MGNNNFNLQSNTLRCENCFSLRRMTIEPKLPQSFIIFECRCGSSRINMQHFLSELHKGNFYKVQCYKCSKEDKNSIYCNNCNYLLCSSCYQSHIANNTNKNHKFISPSKLDFYCIQHQKELLVAYCFDCSVNFCKICENENIHSKHNFCLYKHLILNKKEKKILKQKLKYAQIKLEYNTKVTALLSKKLESEDMKKKLSKAERNNFKENQNLLEVLNFMLYVYDNSKNKNYSIIHNVVKNINLNINRYKFSKNTSVDMDAELLLGYFEEDLILKNGVEMEKIINKKLEKSESKLDFDEDIESANKTMISNSKHDFEVFEINYNNIIENEEDENKINNYDKNMINTGKNQINNYINNSKSKNI